MGITGLKRSHRDPVYETVWIGNKTEDEFFTASSDGTVRPSMVWYGSDLVVVQVLWWDTRNLKEPQDMLIINPGTTVQDLDMVTSSIEPTLSSTLP